MNSKDGLDGISHITVVVQDLDRASRFFVEGLLAREIYDSRGRNFSISREKFFLIGGIWVAAMEGAPKPRSYHHVAFSVADAELDLFESRLRKLGIEMRPSRPRVSGEGRSLYFYDFDNNLYELHSGSLEERLRRYQADGSERTLAD